MRRTIRLRPSVVVSAPPLAAILLGAAGLCLAPSGAAARTAGPYRIVPGPYTKKPAAGGHDPVARVSVAGVSITAEYLDPPARAAFVRSIDPGLEDPFVGRVGGSDLFNAFRVVFDNRSKEDVSFQPGNVVLIASRTDEQHPIDLTDLYRAVSSDGSEDAQGLIDRVTPVIYDQSTSIPSGTRLSRLLVFRHLSDAFKELRLEFSFLQIGVDTKSVTFLFHREPLAN